MAIISKYKVLKKAKDSFTKSNYKEALEQFALVLQNFPASKEAQNGVILSEMAMSGESGAEALFDYYELLREDDAENADIIIDEILHNLDGALDQIGTILSEPIKEKLTYEDGILYEDLKLLVEERGDFKEVFENIMFSTKVIITQKDDFIDFLNNLIEHNFTDMALGYLENILAKYPTDLELIKLLQKLSINEEIKGISIEN